MLDKLEIIEKVRDDLSLRFEFPKPPPLRNPSMIVFDQVTFGYFGEQPNTYILRNIDLRFNYGDKVGILGANGAGKSTLVKLIMGKRKPVLGSATMTNEVQVGYFSQHHVDDLDMNMTPLQQLSKEFGSEITRQQLYAQLGRFNLGKSSFSSLCFLVSASECDSMSTLLCEQVRIWLREGSVHCLVVKNRE